MSAWNGVLPVDKPTGPTSHDVVAVARRALGERRIGHTGTLDPFASGLLLLCLGPATRLAEYLTGLPKSYQATMRLGVVTDTDDIEGVTVRADERWPTVTREMLATEMADRVGDQLQLPPLFSAKRVAGERAYAAARAGRSVPMEPVPVRISRLEVTRFSPPKVDFEVDCSSGTYIRSIARDLGEALGVGAHLTALRRTRIGSWSVESAVPVDALGHLPTVEAAVRTPTAAVSHLPAAVLGADEMARVANGGAIPREGPLPGGPIALLAPDGSLAAIGEAEGAGLRPRKVFL